MPSNYWTALGLCGALVACGAPPGTSEISQDSGVDAPPPIAQRLLFVGNSCTYVNDLPAVVQALAAASPRYSFSVESVARGGAHLANHWITTGARTRIESGEFDFVVLQGQSLEPLTQPENFDQYALLLADATNQAGAQGVWFATWARREGDPVYQDPRYVDPAFMTSNIELRYAAAATRNGDALARVGAAWQDALAIRPDISLHSEDGSHPTAAGTLLTACVLYYAITGTAPQMPNPPPLGIEIDAATHLCGSATP